MIISASRRTDIPAFYSKWFMNRVRRGWCLVPNPFNRQQVSRVSLDPAEVEAFVFWTRNPRPLMRSLDELDDLGCRYYFLFTTIGYPRRIDPGSPPLDVSIKNFRDLSARIGPEKVIWRYDPIVLSESTGPDFHENNFRRLALALNGSTGRCIVSFMKPYRKARARLEAAAPGSLDPIDFKSSAVCGLLHSIAETGRENGMEIYSCAGEEDLSPFGLQPSRCIDGGLISRLFGVETCAAKDPYQRKECGCTAGRDIGMYDSCLFGCSYCYATTSFERAKANHARHDPESPSLL